MEVRKRLNEVQRNKFSLKGNSYFSTLLLQEMNTINFSLRKICIKKTKKKSANTHFDKSVKIIYYSVNLSIFSDVQLLFNGLSRLLVIICLHQWLCPYTMAQFDNIQFISHCYTFQYLS